MSNECFIFDKLLYFAYILFKQNIKIKPIDIDLSDFILTTFSFILSSIFAFFIAKYTLKRTDKLNKQQRNITLYSTAIGLSNELKYIRTLATDIIENPKITTEEFNMISSKFSFELFKSFPSEILELLDYNDKITFLNLFHETQIQQIPLHKEEDTTEAIELIKEYIKLIASFETVLEKKYINKNTPTSI